MSAPTLPTRPVTPTGGGAALAPSRLSSLVPGVLATVLAGMCLAHLTTTNTYGGVTWALATGLAAVILAVLAFAFRKRTLRGNAAHALLAGCLLVAAADGLVYLSGHGGLERTGEVMLVVGCAGAVLGSAAWYRGTIAVLCGWWALAALTGPLRLQAFHAAAILSSVVMSRAVRTARMEAVAHARAVEAALRKAHADHAAASKALARVRAQVREAGVVDQLTGLPDRNGLELIGKHLVAIARRESGAVGCTFLSVPGLEKLRATHGQEASDALFTHLAKVLRSVTRATDVVARWSEDRLVVVTHGAGAPMDVLQERVVRRLPQDCPVAETAWSRELVLGRSVMEPWDEGGLVSLVAAADTDLHTRLGLPAPETGTDAAAEASAVARMQATAAAAELLGEASAHVSIHLDAGPGAGGERAAELVSVAAARPQAWAAVIKLPPGL